MNAFLTSPRFFRALLLGAAVLGCAAAAPGTGPSDPVAAETAWDRAVVQRDANALSSILADRFIELSDDGATATKAQTIHDVLTSKTMPQSNYTTDRVVRITGDTALVSGIYVEEGRVSATDPRRYRLKARYADAYARTAEGWKAVMGFGHTLSARVIK